MTNLGGPYPRLSLIFDAVNTPMQLTEYSVNSMIADCVSWTVEVTDSFDQWWGKLTEDERVSVDGMIRILEAHGPTLGPPYSVDTVGSRFPALRQLRVPHAFTEICVLYVVNQLRSTLLLLIGITAEPGQDPCPPEHVQIAESIYRTHLARLRGSE